MTISSQVNKSGPYFYNGATTAFAYGFKIDDAAHIRVVESVISTGAETDLVLDSDYTVTGVGDDAGTVVISPARAAGKSVTMVRNVPFTQDVELENQGAYFAKVVESALDAGVARAQQLQEQIDRAVIVPVSSDPADISALIGGVQALIGNVDDVITVAANIGAVQGASANAAAAGAAAVLTAADAVATAADRVQTGLDAVATAADRVQTGLDAAAAAASAGSIEITSGLWTPSLEFSGASVGIVYLTQIGRWSRVGKKVTLDVYILTSSKGSSTGPATISGLPFPAKSLSPMVWTAGVGYRNTPWTAVGIINGFSEINLYNGIVQLTSADFTIAPEFAFTLEYEVD